MSVLRPLPPRPSLEFEHKEAKALLRRLRAGDPDSLTRARERHSSIDPARPRLADAQLVIAREYGFASWPKLVRYFKDLERPRFRGTLSAVRSMEGHARWFVKEHRERRPATGQIVAAYVPRFYGLRGDAVFAEVLTDDEARLALARMYGFPSWQELIECAEEEEKQRRSWDDDPLMRAGDAMRAGDVAALKGVVAAHPELLRPSAYDVSRRRSILAFAIDIERSTGRDAMRPIIGWLASQGLDFQRELNSQLCRAFFTRGLDDIRYLLERGADPNWVSPGGVTVLEHALISYWNGEWADLIAERVVPRKALWIAAGLGDVDSVRASLDRSGKPTKAATRLRPDFGATRRPLMAQSPEPDDEELLLEAFLVAMLNSRTRVLEYMVSRGFPVNTLRMGMPLIAFAAGNLFVDVTACLVRCGADPDLKASPGDSSAREVAAEWFGQKPDDPTRRRIAEELGLNTEAILAEHRARQARPPGYSAVVELALELAGDDAFRQGRTDIGAENLLIGLLQQGGPPRDYFTQALGAEMDRFKADFGARLSPSLERVERAKLPFDAEAQAVLQAAVAIATERHREVMMGVHILHAITRAHGGPVAGMLAGYGASWARAETLESAL